MKLLVLSTLRYFGRGWTFDDFQEVTAINHETARQFLRKFVEFGSSTLYNTYVINPTSSMDMQDYELEFLMAGFPGCIGSTDVSHIIMELCSYRLRQIYLGYKVAHTAITYNMTVNHCRIILNITQGHLVRFTDKTLVLLDDLVNELHDGKCDDVHEFTLMNFDQDSDIIYVKYNGFYIIVDNGYLIWSVTSYHFSYSSIISPPQLPSVYFLNNPLHQDE